MNDDKTIPLHKNLAPEDPIEGFAIFIIHILLAVFFYLYLLFGKINIFYYLLVVVWVGVMSMHFYFKGCLLTKIERNSWKSTDWEGPWTLLFSLLKKNELDLSNNFKTNIYICFGIIISIIIVTRIVFN